MTLVMAVCVTNSVPANAQYSSLIGIGTHVLRHAARYSSRNNSSVNTGNLDPSLTPPADGTVNYGSPASSNPSDITGTGYYNGQTYSGTSYPANNRRSHANIGSGVYINGAPAAPTTSPTTGFGGSFNAGTNVDYNTGETTAAGSGSAGNSSAGNSSGATATNSDGTIPPFSTGSGQPSSFAHLPAPSTPPVSQPQMPERI